MPARIPSPTPENGGTPRLDDLVSSVDALRTDLDDLRRALAAEIRTRRVVVTDGDGFARVVVSADSNSAHASVCCRTHDGESTRVELFATDPIDATAAHVGLALVQRGNIIGAVDAAGERRAWLWIDEQP